VCGRVGCSCFLVVPSAFSPASSSALLRSLPSSHSPPSFLPPSLHIPSPQTLVNMLNESKLAKTTEVVIAPSSVHLHKALSKVRPDIAVAAQDVWTQGGGAFTGETSAEMLKDLGAKWTLTGK